jgi:hypothetical protein
MTTSDSLQSISFDRTLAECATGNWSCVTKCPDDTFCCGANNTACCSSGEGGPLITYPSDQALNDDPFLASIMGTPITPPTAATSSKSSGTVALPSPSTSNSSSASEHIPSPKSMIGVEVGVPLGLVCCALAIFICVRECRYRHLTKKQAWQNGNRMEEVGPKIGTELDGAVVSVHTSTTTQAELPVLNHCPELYTEIVSELR